MNALELLGKIMGWAGIILGILLCAFAAVIGLTSSMMSSMCSREEELELTDDTEEDTKDASL